VIVSGFFDFGFGFDDRVCVKLIMLFSLQLSPRTIICPAEAEGLTQVLHHGNVKIDSRDIVWETYQEVFDLLGTWDDSFPPRLITDNQVRQIPDDGIASPNEEDRLVAVGGFPSPNEEDRFPAILEDGLELSESSDDANVTDVEPNMYARRSQGDASLGGLEAFLLRKQEGDPQKLQSMIEGAQGMAGNLVTVSGAHPDSASIDSKDPRAEST
jgi:hypothetical protein